MSSGISSTNVESAHPSSANETGEIPLLFGGTLSASDASWPGCKLGRDKDSFARAASRQRVMNKDDIKNERDIPVPTARSY